MVVVLDVVEEEDDVGTMRVSGKIASVNDDDDDDDDDDKRQ